MSHLAGAQLLSGREDGEPLARLRCLIGIVRAGRREELPVEIDCFGDLMQ
jgi:hypothetical protein